MSGKEFRTGGYVGVALASVLSDYLNRTGSIILILTLLFLAVILATQFSFGRLFAALADIVRDQIAVGIGAVRSWREEKRRDRQRQEVLKKHLDRQPKETREAPVPPPVAKKPDGRRLHQRSRPRRSHRGRRRWSKPQPPH